MRTNRAQEWWNAKKLAKIRQLFFAIPKKESKVRQKPRIRCSDCQDAGKEKVHTDRRDTLRGKNTSPGERVPYHLRTLLSSKQGKNAPAAPWERQRPAGQLTPLLFPLTSLPPSYTRVYPAS